MGVRQVVSSQLEETPMVPEDTGDSVIKPIFDDIKASFRAPIVGDVFRVLATEPPYLQQAWRQLKPNVLTAYFERQSEALREQAVHGIASLGGSPRPPAEAVEALKVLHYVTPKLLLAVAAMRAATAGERPRLRQLAPDDTRRIEAGPPEGVPLISSVDPENPGDEAGRIVADIRATTGEHRVRAEERVLLHWPAYFAWAWQSLKPGIGHPEYRSLQRSLRRLAEEAVLSMPFRMELSPHTLRLCGLSETQVDLARATLDGFYAQLSGSAINVAFWAIGAFGEYDAARSPFPATLP